MEEKVIRATVFNNEVRVFCTVMSRTVGEAEIRHHTSPVATAALGRALIATALICMTLKNDETVTVRVIGDGPLGGIIVNGNGQIEVRGYVKNPGVDIPLKNNGKLDVGKAVGREGYLHVTKDLRLKEPYTGTVPLVTGELGEDFTSYFANSEQTPSAVALGVLVGTDYHVVAAGGLLIQLMPEATEETISKVEEIVRELPPITELVTSGFTPENIVERVFGKDVKLLEEKAVCFACSCSRERLENILLSLGEKELNNIRQEKGQVELVCHFCNEVYHFTREDLDKIIETLRQGKET